MKHLWPPGQSGNLRGRPLGTRDAVGSVIRKNKKSPARLVSNLRRLQKSKDEHVALKATIAEIEFGWGKPVQPVSGDPDNPLLQAVVYLPLPSEGKSGGIKKDS